MRRLPNKSWTFFDGAMGFVMVETLAVIIYLLLLPRDPKNSVLLGYSLQRLLLIAVPLIGLIVMGLFWRHYHRTTEYLARLWREWTSGKAFGSLHWLLLVLVCAGFTYANYPAGWLDETLQAYYERLRPLVIWFTLIGAEYLLFVLVCYSKPTNGQRAELRKLLPLAAAILTGLIALGLIFRLTGWGWTPDPTSWRNMGAPLLTWQILLAAVGGLLWLLLERKSVRLTLAKNWLDILLCLVIYGLTFWLWMSQPIQNSFFSPEARPPNHEVYPYSDAMYYALSAESVTAGAGLYGWSVTPRPFYLTVLSWIVELTGGRYESIILWLTALLALIPVVLYLLGKRLDGRALGLTLAGLAAAREINTILATKAIQLSHSKMIMADLPSLLAVLILTLVWIRWLKKEGSSPLWALLTGGCLGWVMLFRTQAIVFLPFLPVLKWLQTPSMRNEWVRPLLTFALGLVLMVSPWLIRNYNLTGKFLFDDPSTQIGMLTSRYSADDAGEQTDGSVMNAIITNPGMVAGFVLNHTARNLISVVFVTPPQAVIESVDSITTGTPFWQADTFQLDFVQTLQILLILALMAFGATHLFRRVRWVGLAPLVILFAYCLSNGLARNSGGRYNLPVDWVGYFYLAAGLLAAGGWLIRITTRPAVRVQAVRSGSEKVSALKFAVAGLSLLLVGALIPITEHVFPNRYAQVDAAGAQQLLQRWSVDASQAASMLSDPESVVVYGREMYPRFYKPGVGEGGSSWASYASLNFCRMGFVMVTNNGIRQVLVMLDRPPASFANRSDALVIGKKTSLMVKDRPVEVVQAQWIVLKGTPPVVVTGLDSAPEKCRMQP